MFSGLLYSLSLILQLRMLSASEFGYILEHIRDFCLPSPYTCSLCFTPRPYWPEDHSLENHSEGLYFWDSLKGHEEGHSLVLMLGWSFQVRLSLAFDCLCFWHITSSPPSFTSLSLSLFPSLPPSQFERISCPSPGLQRPLHAYGAHTYAQTHICTHEIKINI